MRISKVQPNDFHELYRIGESTPELRVSATEKFMEKDEFSSAITDPHAVFLVAREENKIVGFIYADGQYAEKPFRRKYGCVVYLAVLPGFRRRGIAKMLHGECERRLKKMGITHIYGWASKEGSGTIIPFMKKQGFVEGHGYVWMDKEL